MAQLTAHQKKALKDALDQTVHKFVYEFVPAATRAWEEGKNVAGKDARKASKEVEVLMKDFRKLTLEFGLK